MRTTQLFKSLLLSAVVLLTTYSIQASAPTTEVVFSSVKVEAALQRAKLEGKLIFLDFSAKWCTPCKWMEETTFKDPEVIDKLKAEYIAVKVDIDEPQGAAVKSTYDINYLPTMLILNSKGQLVEKIEKTMTAPDLYTLLERHDSPNNKTVVTYQPNTAPSTAITTRTLEKNDDYTISSADYKKYQDKEDRASVYKLQMGAFSSFQAAHEKKQHLKEIFFEPILVIKDSRFDKDIFKVIMGEFQTLEEAESFQVILKNDFGLESIIR